MSPAPTVSCADSTGPCLACAIVGIEIPIDRLEAKLKASQDEEMPDRLGTVAGLESQAHGAGDAMANLVRGAI